MRRLAGVAGFALAVLAVAGCADAQPGDQNNGPGYTNNAADLQVKVDALQSDPCRGKQATQIYPSCGRYVTEIANSVITLRDTVPAETTSINAMANAATTFQKLSCDTVTGQPSATQTAECPQALLNIGIDLDKIEQALASAPSSSTP